MDERSHRTGIENDLRDAPARRVIYLEGEEDLPCFFALIGIAQPRDRTHQGVLVRSLHGRSSVRVRVEIAAEHGLHGIHGVIDGDGDDLTALEKHFDPPYCGPLFRWKAYCIENLLVKTGWPASWGDPPDWRETLRRYAAYSALNQVHREIQRRLRTVDLDQFRSPELGKPLLDAAAVRAALEADKGQIESLDVSALFGAELETLEQAVRRGLDEGHARINGKWLLGHMAPEKVHKAPDTCRHEWVEHALQAGGLNEVKGFWRRITGRDP